VCVCVLGMRGRQCVCVCVLGMRGRQCVCVCVLGMRGRQYTCERECKQVFPCVFFNLFLQELRKQLKDLRENVFTKDASGMLNLNGLLFSFVGLFLGLF